MANLIRGICHPYGDLKQVKECGFEWVRTDCPYPFDENGCLSERYLWYKHHCSVHKDNGFKVMSITPNPRAFMHLGIDSRTDEGFKRTSEVISFIAEDMKELVDGWQVGNELNVYFFRAPFNFDEAIDFIVASLKGIKKVSPNILLGYNFSEYDETSIYMMKKLLPYNNLYNYIGYDGYCGTWIEGTPDDFIIAIEEIYKLTGTPVLMQEFGFASKGDVIEPGEFDETMKKYGFNNFEQAQENCELFLERIPKRLAYHIKSAPRYDWEPNLRHLEPHIMKKWVGGSDEYPHTKEGQAKFYDVLLGKLKNMPNFLGFMVFSWRDAGRCFFCHEDDCPCETAWGLIDREGQKKPSFYAVQKHLVNM